MICYGGVYLPCPSAEIVRWISENIPPSAAYMFSYPELPPRVRWPFPGRTDDRKVSLGTLHWPTGAQRWAVYHGLVCDDDLETLRPLVYANSTLNALTLRLDDGMVLDGAGNALVSLYDADGIKTNLYMLPPMPLAQCSPHLDTDRMLYLITLVDERYFWWQQSADIVISGGTTTWEDLIDSIETALGITIAHTAIESEWLKPAEALTSRYQHLPLLLDAVGVCTGRKLVRSRDGTITLQKPREAKTVQDGQVRDWPKQAGGLYHFVQSFSDNDLYGLVPRQVDVIFQEAKNGTPTGNPHKISTTLASLALAEYGSCLGFTGERVYHDACIANLLGSSTVSANLAELTTLAQAVARDFYLWKLGRVETVFAGIAPYAPEGLSEVIEWTHTEVQVNTRVRRGVWDDRVEDLLHHGTYGSSTNPGGDPGIVIDDVITLTKNVVIEPSAPCSGPILTVTPPPDHPDPITVINQVPETTPSGVQPVKAPIVTTENYGVVVTPPPTEWPNPGFSIVLPSGYPSNPIEVGYSGYDPIYELKPGGTVVIKPVLPTDPGLIISLPPGYTDYPFYIEDPLGNKIFTIDASGKLGSGSVDQYAIGSGQVNSGHLASGLIEGLISSGTSFTSVFSGIALASDYNARSGGGAGVWKFVSGMFVTIPDSNQKWLLEADVCGAIFSGTGVRLFARLYNATVSGPIIHSHRNVVRSELGQQAIQNFGNVSIFAPYMSGASGDVIYLQTYLEQTLPPAEAYIQGTSTDGTPSSPGESPTTLKLVKLA